MIRYNPIFHGTLKAYVVDDSAADRFMIKRPLQGIADNVREAYDPIQALADHYLIQSDVIITDHDMPRMDGIEFVRQLRQQGYAGRIIATSGRTDVEKKFFKVGADAFIPKDMDRYSSLITLPLLLIACAIDKAKDAN